jgi:hypothetical protein
MNSGSPLGGDSFTNFSTNRAGPSGSSADHEPSDRLRSSQLGGLGTPSLIVALVLVALCFVAILIF